MAYGNVVPSILIVVETWYDKCVPGILSQREELLRVECAVQVEIRDKVQSRTRFGIVTTPTSSVETSD